MRRSLAKFSESEVSNHTPSLADFTTTTPELKFSVHTATHVRRWLRPIVQLNGRGRRFSRQQRGTPSGRNGLSVFVVLARRRRLQAQTGLASGRSSKVTTAAFRSRWCRLAATIRPIISCQKCGGYDADRRKQFYVRDRGRFVSDDPRRAIHHQRRLRDRA